MSQRPLHSPLTDEHLTQIRAQAPAIERAKAQIALAKRAGLNVDQQEQQVQKNEDTLRRIAQTYFPGEGHGF